jgi:hypothetical protein
MNLRDELSRMGRGRLLGLGAGGVAGMALIGVGVWMATRPSAPGLPHTAQEAAAVLASGRLDLLDDERRRQYMQETHRLMQELSEEERRALFEDEALRRAMRDARRDRMEEIAREYARTGELPEFPGGRRGPGGPGGPGGEQMRERLENMTEDERAQFREERRREMADQVTQNAATGNAQNTGLQQEMMKRMQKQREQGGGNRQGGGR